MSKLSEYAERYEIAEITRDDGVLEVRFHSNGGPLRFGREVHREWPALFADIKRDRDNRIVILTGAGDALIPPRLMLRDRKYTPESWRELFEEGRDLIYGILDIPVPVIAAVNGPVHIHSEVALLSDIVVAAHDTTFRDLCHVPEQMIPGDGMHVVMPMLMGRLRASYFLLTGQVIDAGEAKQIGLVNEVLPREQVLDRARELAHKLLAQPAANLRYTRMILTHEVRARMHGLLELGMAVEGLAALDSRWDDWELPIEGDWPGFKDQAPG
ncbi:MAG: enoyl-CoA hydratase/isomerase family protein [Actinobacteria bacterium]|nr:enoyl-CoA hydratase/isomerase family protein [Actinomycetota bacterium]